MTLPCLEVLKSIETSFSIYIPETIASASLWLLCLLPKRIPIKFYEFCSGTIHRPCNSYVQKNKRWWRYIFLSKSNKKYFKIKRDSINARTNEFISLFKTLGAYGDICANALIKDKEIFLSGLELQNMLDCRKD